MVLFLQFFMLSVLKLVLSQDAIFSGCNEAGEEYIFIDNNVESGVANLACISLGVDAVGITIPDQPTYDKVKLFMNSRDIDTSLWLNLQRDFDATTPRDYKSRVGVEFVGDFARFLGILPWEEDEPSSLLSSDNLAQRCVEMRAARNNFEWRDQDCGNTRRSLCTKNCTLPTTSPTKSPTQSPTTSPTNTNTPTIQIASSMPSSASNTDEDDVFAFNIFMALAILVFFLLTTLAIFHQWLLKTLKNTQNTLQTLRQ